MAAPELLFGMQSAHHLQASVALFDIQTNTCQKTVSHPLAGVGNWQKKSGISSSRATKENECEVFWEFFFFGPPVQELNIDFIGRLQGLILVSTKMFENNKPFSMFYVFNLMCFFFFFPFPP